ncbi:MAG: PilT/PilU family type 4a pilus ATPase [Candidatus Competibacterales bacterium]|nr:PilT/PilU family type 4a pilus ATPase [Candidatus Competibacterales bacterium]
MESDQAFRYIYELAEMMVKEGGSDLFVTAGSAPAIKVSGAMRRVGTDALSAEQADYLVRSIMNDRTTRQFDEHHEANFALHFEDLARFRVSAFKQRGASSMVLRLIRSDIPSFEQLHLPSTLRDLSMTKRGLIIFVGATGSGKSTSLAAMVDYRNENSFGHIITIEDPIEFFHQHKKSLVNQREVGADTDSYEIALKNTLRQAPDVILVGEVRDRAGMEAAIAFAETGHLVLTTLHANNADQAFDRIVNFFPDEKKAQIQMDLSFNLRAIISQRLIPRSDIKGLIPAVEVLINTPLVAELIFQGRIREIKETMTRSGEQGLITFDQSLFRLYEENRIDYQTALRFADSVNNLRLMIKLKSKRQPPSDGAADKFHIKQTEKDQQATRLG